MDKITVSDLLATRLPSKRTTNDDRYQSLVPSTTSKEKERKTQKCKHCHVTQRSRELLSIASYESTELSSFPQTVPSCKVNRPKKTNRLCYRLRYGEDFSHDIEDKTLSMFNHSNLQQTIYEMNPQRSTNDDEFRKHLNGCITTFNHKKWQLYKDRPPLPSTVVKRPNSQLVCNRSKLKTGADEVSSLGSIGDDSSHRRMELNFWEEKIADDLDRIVWIKTEKNDYEEYNLGIPSKNTRQNDNHISRDEEDGGERKQKNKDGAAEKSRESSLEVEEIDRGKQKSEMRRPENYFVGNEQPVRQNKETFMILMNDYSKHLQHVTAEEEAARLQQMPEYAFSDALSEESMSLDLVSLSRDRQDWRTITDIRPKDPVEELIVDRLIEMIRLERETMEMENNGDKIPLRSAISRQQRERFPLPPPTPNNTPPSNRRCSAECLQPACIGDCPTKLRYDSTVCQLCLENHLVNSCLENAYVSRCRSTTRESRILEESSGIMEESEIQGEDFYSIEKLRGLRAQVQSKSSAKDKLETSVPSTHRRISSNYSVLDDIRVVGTRHYISGGTSSQDVSRPGSRGRYGILPGKAYHSQRKISLTERPKSMRLKSAAAATTVRKKTSKRHHEKIRPHTAA